MSGDTPRTDAACNSAADWGEVIELARQLERELAAAKAENERLCKINDSDSMTFERGMARIVAERDHERERAERCEQSSADLASATAHRACCGTEHDPINGRLHGYCVVCGVPWPCETASYFLRRAAVEVEGAR